MISVHHQFQYYNPEHNDHYVISHKNIQTANNNLIKLHNSTFSVHKQQKSQNWQREVTNHLHR